MEKLKGKRLLILGGSTWRNAIADFAKDNGITLIAASNDPNAKFFEIAQESYVISSTDADAMKKLIRDKKIDGVYMASHEVVIDSACEYLRELNLPCYCTKNQWTLFRNKESFKKACASVGLPVLPQIEVDENNIKKSAEKIIYPVITKPVDGCGSNGFSVCRNVEEFLTGYNKARQNSLSKKVIIEKFVNNSSVVAFYTFSDGKAFFSGLERKYPVHYKDTDSYVAGLHLFESNLVTDFRSKFEEKLTLLFEKIELREGSLWMEIFHDGENYYFNEAGYRYGGSVSIYPVDYFYNINQVAADLHYCLTGKSRIYGHKSLIPSNFNRKKFYAIYDIHMKAGTIAKIRGINEFIQRDNVLLVAESKSIGDTVEHSGTFGQVFGLAHFVFDSREELIETINDIHRKIIVEDNNGNNLVNKMLDVETETKDFFS